MTDEEREKRNAPRRRDLERPLEYMKLFLGTMDDLLEAQAKQAHDCIAMFKYLAMHPLMGNFIPGAADWGEEKAKRTLGIRGKIAADCALFRRENGGIRCLAWPQEEAAQVLEKRRTYSNNRLGKQGGGVQSIDCSIDKQITKKEKEIEIERENIPIETAVSFHNPPTPTERPADGRMETPADTEGGNLFKPGNRPASVLKRPKDAGEVEQAARYLLPPEMLDDAPIIAKAFFESNEAMGWTDEEGNPVQNWMNRLRAYCKACDEHGVFSKPDDTQAKPQDSTAAHEPEFKRPGVQEVIEKLRRYRSCESLDEAGLMAKVKEFYAYGDRMGWRNSNGKILAPRAWSQSFFRSFMGGELTFR